MCGSRRKARCDDNERRDLENIMQVSLAVAFAVLLVTCTERECDGVEAVVLGRSS